MERHPILSAFMMALIAGAGASIATWVFAAGQMTAEVEEMKAELERRRPIVESVGVIRADLDHIKQQTKSLPSIENSLVRLTVQVEAINHRLAREDQ